MGAGMCVMKSLWRGWRSPVDEVDVTEDDIAQIYYTSGTTGRPKGVMLTHKNVTVHALGTIAELHLTDRDVWLHAAPLFHLADAWATWAITWVGGTHVLVERVRSTGGPGRDRTGKGHADQSDPHHAQHAGKSSRGERLRLPPACGCC